METAIIPLCQHWMDNTTRCGSPAMRGTRYCYSHRLQQARDARKNAERTRQRWFESAPLNNVPSVQRALAQVMTQLLSGNISHKRAGQILYKLQTASVNLRTAGLRPENTNYESSQESGQNGTDCSRPFCDTAAMTTQTIAEYLDEERQKFENARERVDAEAARIQPLQHGHHRMAKRPKLELVPPMKAATKKKKKKAIAHKATPAAGKKITKIRKRA